MSAPETIREVQGRVNVCHEEIYANIRANIRRPLPQVKVYPPNGEKVVLLCGGPSLADHEQEIRRLRTWKPVTVNGTHQWAQDHGIRPRAHVQLDARELNARFVAEPVDKCRYLIASQCHPAVFQALRGQEVHIWHGDADEERKILDRYYLGHWVPVRGGSSVGTRALWLLYLLGFRHIRIYGMDCSLRRGKHHSYPQAENGQDNILTVKAAGRVFKSHMWMLKQCDEIMQMAPHLPNDLQLDFRGDGLLTHLINVTAERQRPVRAKVIERAA